MTATEKPNLTLYGIETQLLELLNFRDSIQEDPDMTPQEQAESLKACDESIAEYLRAEVKKCDGIAGYLREFEARAAAEAEEIERLKRRKQMWEKRRESLANMVIDIMQNTGATRLDGRHNVLSLRKNPPSVEIVQPDMVPSGFMRVPVKLNLEDWWRILAAIQQNVPLWATLSDAVTSAHSEPIKSEILKRLKEGDGVPGCRLRTDSVRLEVK